MTRPLGAGEKVLLVDSKGRQYLVELVEGGEFHTHTGVVPHAELIGQVEGATVRSTTGARYSAMRPTLTDFVLRMPRGAQVIYPKDLGPILLLADIEPGVHVFESGVGSGALSMTLLRAGAIVTGYEVRDDFAERARQNVHSFLGADAASRYHVEVRDTYAGIDARAVDRVILDLPEPWQVIKHAAVAMRPGGILVSYSPSIAQVMQLHEAFEDSGFHLAQTVEILQRTWHVEGQAVRPDHRMVAHTGFLTSARLLGEIPGGLKAPRIGQS
ncbi:MAG: tRNA (adenine57-N1/adenine58-N1)-methyltransferase catalytic subunit [Actinomycetota bacterium]|nr:tRNA (adenine57-N1/adenine58-N1)-methyltransferase catalytic subunit [Actinomycetota bacterium]